MIHQRILLFSVLCEIINIFVYLRKKFVCLCDINDFWCVLKGDHDQVSYYNIILQVNTSLFHTSAVQWYGIAFGQIYCGGKYRRTYRSKLTIAAVNQYLLVYI